MQSTFKWSQLKNDFQQDQGLQQLIAGFSDSIRNWNGIDQVSRKLNKVLRYYSQNYRNDKMEYKSLFDELLLIIYSEANKMSQGQRYSQTLDLLDYGLELIQEQKHMVDQEVMYFIFELMGTTYNNIKEFKKALMYQNQAYKVLQNNKIERLYVKNYMNMCLVLINLNHYQKALNCAKNAVIISQNNILERKYQDNREQKSLIVQLSYGYQYMGICNHHLKKQQKAIYCHKKAFENIEKYFDEQQPIYQKFKDYFESSKQKYMNILITCEDESIQNQQKMARTFNVKNNNYLTDNNNSRFNNQQMHSNRKNNPQVYFQNNKVKKHQSHNCGFDYRSDNNNIHRNYQRKDINFPFQQERDNEIVSYFDSIQKPKCDRFMDVNEVTTQQNERDFYDSQYYPSISVGTKQKKSKMRIKVQQQTFKNEQNHNLSRDLEQQKREQENKKKQEELDAQKKEQLKVENKEYLKAQKKKILLKFQEREKQQKEEFEKIKQDIEKEQNDKLEALKEKEQQIEKRKEELEKFYEEQQQKHKQEVQDREKQMIQANQEQMIKNQEEQEKLRKQLYDQQLQEQQNAQNQLYEQIRSLQNQQQEQQIKQNEYESKKKVIFNEMQIQTDNPVKEISVQCEKRVIINEMTMIVKKNYDPFKKIKQYQIIMIQRCIKRCLKRMKVNMQKRLEQIKSSALTIQRLYRGRKWRQITQFANRNKHRLDNVLFYRSLVVLNDGDNQLHLILNNYYEKSKKLVQWVFKCQNNNEIYQIEETEKDTRLEMTDKIGLQNYLKILKEYVIDKKDELIYKDDKIQFDKEEKVDNTKLSGDLGDSQTVVSYTGQRTSQIITGNDILKIQKFSRGRKCKKSYKIMQMSNNVIYKHMFSKNHYLVILNFQKVKISEIYFKQLMQQQQPKMVRRLSVNALKQMENEQLFRFQINGITIDKKGMKHDLTNFQIPDIMVQNNSFMLTKNWVDNYIDVDTEQNTIKLSKFGQMQYYGFQQMYLKLKVNIDQLIRIQSLVRSFLQRSRFKMKSLKMKFSLVHRKFHYSQNFDHQFIISTYEIHDIQYYLNEFTNHNNPNIKNCDNQKTFVMKIQKKVKDWESEDFIFQVPKQEDQQNLQELIGQVNQEVSLLRNKKGCLIIDTQKINHILNPSMKQKIKGQQITDSIKRQALYKKQNKKLISNNQNICKSDEFGLMIHSQESKKLQNMDNIQVINYVIKNKFIQMENEEYCLQKQFNQLKAKRIIVRSYKLYALKRNLKQIQNFQIRRENIDSYKQYYMMNFPTIQEDYNEHFNEERNEKDMVFLGKQMNSKKFGGEVTKMYAYYNTQFDQVVIDIYQNQNQCTLVIMAQFIFMVHQNEKNNSKEDDESRQKRREFTISQIQKNIENLVYDNIVLQNGKFFFDKKSNYQYICSNKEEEVVYQTDKNINMAQDEFKIYIIGNKQQEYLVVKAQRLSGQFSIILLRLDLKEMLKKVMSANVRNSFFQFFNYGQFIKTLDVKNDELVMNDPEFIQQWINTYLSIEDKKMIIVKVLSKIFKVKKYQGDPIDAYETYQKKQGFYCYSQFCKIVSRQTYIIRILFYEQQNVKQNLFVLIFRIRNLFNKDQKYYQNFKMSVKDIEFDQSVMMQLENNMSRMSDSQKRGIYRILVTDICQKLFAQKYIHLEHQNNMKVKVLSTHKRVKVFEDENNF